MPRSIHYRNCHLCEALCGIEVEAEGSRILAIRGDRQDPFSRGHVCPKVQALREIHEDPDRLRQPQRRVGDRWHTVAWEEALDEAASRLREIQARHGKEAVAIYLGNPSVHNYGTLLYGPLLWRALRTPNLFSATSLDQLPHMVAARMMFGHQLLLPIPDLERTDFLLLLGANPLVSQGSLLTAGDMGRRLRELRERGGRLVVVDPVRTRTAALADQHLFLRPGTDALFLLALLHELFRARLVRPGALAGHLQGLERLERLVVPFAPASVAPETGVAATEIQSLARDFAAAPRAVCYGRLGVCTQRQGGLAAWLINVLNVVTGRLDEPGGALFPAPAVDLLRLTRPCSLAKRRSRVRGLPSFGAELPAAALAEEIDTAGPGRVRALVTCAGNPVLSGPRGTRLEKALPQLELMVSIDIYRNETTRHAHLILPPTFGLEHDHYDLVFHGLAVRNGAKYNPPLFERTADARHDWEILLGLATRLRSGRTAGRWLGRLSHWAQPVVNPARTLDLLLRLGPYGAHFLPGSPGLNLARLRREVHGMDLGPLIPCLPQRLRTPDRQVQLVPDLYLAEVEALQRQPGLPARPGELLLIGRRHLRSNNSWMHNNARLLKGQDRCTLLMHPRDAQGLTSGQLVRVSSAVGEVTVTLELTDDIMPGVVSLPHGWGHDRPGTQLSVAATRPGVSVNDLTDDAEVDHLTGTAVFNGVQVRVQPC